MSRSGLTTLERKSERGREGELFQSVDPASGSFVRIGCSATVEPLQEVADFLAGNFRPVQVGGLPPSPATSTCAPALPSALI